MASSKWPQPNNDPLIARVHASLTRVLHHRPQSSYHLLIAYSGGLDSSVLLHLLVMLRQQLCSTADAPFQLKLSAMHVHHGLSTHADSWAQHCQQVCQQYAIPLQVVHVNVSRKSGQGVEASARDARYNALQQVAADLICLAHHQQDQAETLLLQLMRGGGAKGLSAMAELDWDQGLMRPLLDISRRELETYANKHALTWVEDDSNQNTDYDRNFMRHKVLPLLATRYPGVHKTLRRTAQHMAEVCELLNDLALQDASQVVAVGLQLNQVCLQVDKLAALNEARAKNLLRWWVAQHGLMMPTAALLNQVLHQLVSARKDAQMNVEISASHSVKRYLGQAYIVKQIVPLVNHGRVWQGEPVLQLNADDSLIFESRVGQGIAQRHLASRQLEIRLRKGGERFKPSIGRPSQTLKHVLQAHAIPPWLRERMPLIWMGDTLVCIPNIGIDPSVAAKPDELGVLIRWQTNP